MSISVTPSSQYIPAASQAAQSTRSNNNQLVQDFQNLTNSLQTGDLAGAQKSYTDLQNLLQSNGAINSAANGTTTSATTTSSTDPGSQVLADFQSIGSALASGNLSQAQQDFAQFQKDIVNAYSQNGGTGAAQGHHHHHHHAKPAGADSDGDSDGSNSSSSATSAASSTASSAASSASSSVSVVA